MEDDACVLEALVEVIVKVVSEAFKLIAVGFDDLASHLGALVLVLMVPVCGLVLLLAKVGVEYVDLDRQPFSVSIKYDFGTAVNRDMDYFLCFGDMHDEVVP